MSDNSPILLWIRRDLRLGDHPGLSSAAQSGRPVIPVFIHDEIVETHGAAPKWRLGLGVEHFARRLEDIGSKLVLRRGRAGDVLRDLVAETGATSVWWSRAYDPASVARDTSVKSDLKALGVDARSFAGHLLFEPWTVQTKTGGFYRVYTPFWKSVRQIPIDPPLAPVSRLTAPQSWPRSEALGDWQMGRAMDRGAEVVRPYTHVGEAAALSRLEQFIAEKIQDYAHARDNMAVSGTSGLSENLTYGEISPRQCYVAGRQALEDGAGGAETFLKELAWREFAYHLAYHTPHIVSENWRETWDAFPWSTDPDAPELLAWKQGRTGVQLVDAAMRELYVTGIMHNRGRMIVASYLTKHLMTHWKAGLKWFEACLIDWDPASNAMGWQWSSGSGPDATPFFRVFNPDTQAEKFDKSRTYRARWLAEPFQHETETARAFFDAIPQSWTLSPDMPYLKPIVGLSEGRARALAAYKAR